MDNVSVQNDQTSNNQIENNETEIIHFTITSMIPLKTFYNYAYVSDSEFSEIISKVIADGERLIWDLNTEQRIECICKYTNAMDHVGFLNLQCEQWEYYLEQFKNSN